MSDNRGEKVKSAKLTEEKVYQIRLLLLNGYRSQTDIAKIFGVTERAIAKIRDRKSWAHLP